jgi:hypothetical protein
MNENTKKRVLTVISNPLFIGVFFALYAFLTRFFVYPKYAFLLQPDAALIESFIEWFGVAYGLFIALVLVNVWAQFDTTEREFDREADAIFMLYQSAKQIKESRKIKPLKEQIINGIKAYVSHVICCFQEEHQKLPLRNAGDKILEDVRDFIGKLIHTDERAPITSELIEKFHEAVDLRGDRISHSKQHMPTPVWRIALASSILWLVPFYGLNFQNDWISVVLVGGVTIVVVAILVIIRDLDDPFEGTWKIDSSEWETLSEKIEPRLTLFFVYSLDNSRLTAIWASVNKMFSRRLCALHSLLGNVQQKSPFFDELARSTYPKTYYKNEYVERYEIIDALPVIVCWSDGRREVLVNSAEISTAATLPDLMNLLRERLAAFRS